ncbi:MAG: carboxypeptidase regulatory-like domain-containing protein [Candidatus Aminicenantes bacterium]|jgi:hypothetical protein
MRSEKLKSFWKKKYYGFPFILLFLLISPSLFPNDCGTIWGVCLDFSEKPLNLVQVTITSPAYGLEKSLQSDESGAFHVVGLPAGLYTIRFAKEGFSSSVQDTVALEPAQTLYIEAALAAQSAGESSFRVIRVDYSSHLNQTVLNELQIHASPTAHNVWSLIENQDLSATTNRIDVGGLWGNQPALFGSRGNSSWTQNTYLLNGFDVSDPYCTGLPLILPDFFSLQFTQLINSGHPASALSPGGYFNLITREESPQLTGSVSTFFIRENYQSSNITPLLEREGIFESHGFDNYFDGNFRLSGPIIPGKINFFSSASVYRIKRDLAEFDTLDKSLATTGLFSVKYRWDESYLRFLWTGQLVSHPTYGAGRNIPYSSTNDRKDLYNILQLVWNSRIANRHVLEAGFCIGLGSQRSDFQEGVFAPHSADLYPTKLSGTAPFSRDNKRQTVSFLFKGESLFPRVIGALHKLQYGFRCQYVRASSFADIQDGLHLHTFEGHPLEIVLFNTPVKHKEAAYHLNFYLQEAVTFSSFISFYVGFHLAVSKGWIPGNEMPQEGGQGRIIDWINLSPRLGCVIPLSPAKTSAVKFSAARYYHTLPLSYLTYGHPNALGAEIFTWDDISSDGFYQPEEKGLLLRREGPFYSVIDSELNRPFTDELSLSYVHTFGTNWTLTIGGFFRRKKNLIETVNTGVPFSSYEDVEISDIGDDRIPDTPDDLTFTIYNQNPETLGQDFFLLTNADSENRLSRYFGLDLTLVKRYGKRFTFFLSLTAINAKGTTNPGNTEWQNDEGVVGKLYDNPNTLINAEGRLRFDRGYTGRLGLTYSAPLGIRIGVILKYYDGQPFARKIIVRGMNQGPFIIQAHPRGKARYEYNRTIDIRIEKIFDIGQSRLRITVDGFNITNRSLATEENEWTGPEFPLRNATEVQSPRIFRIGMAYEF